MGDRQVVAGVLAIWLIAGVVMSIAVTKYFAHGDPGHRSVVPTFRESASLWWSGKDLYTPGTTGFLYLPQSALAFTLIDWRPYLLSDLVWRWACIVLLLSGLWRAAQLFGGEGVQGRAYFTLAALLTLPWAAGSLQSGQVNGPVAGLMLHAAVEMICRRWWRAVGILIVALALKPQGIVMCLLAGAVAGAMSWRMALGLIGFLVAPFLTRPPTYVLAQYRLCVTKLDQAGNPTFGQFEASDLAGLCHRLGLDLPQNVQWGIRAVAAAGTLALCVVLWRRATEARRALLLAFASILYVLLFNPRAQADTYIMLGPVIGLIAAQLLMMAGKGGKPGLGWVMVVLSLLGAMSNNLFHAVMEKPGELFKPVAALAVLAWVVAQVFQCARQESNL